MNSALPTAGPAFTDRATLTHTQGGLAKETRGKVMLFSIWPDLINALSDRYGHVPWRQCTMICRI